MKKGFIFPLAVWLVLMVGCKDDEDNTGANLNDILGTWTLTETIFTDCDSVSQNGNQSHECTSSNCIQYSFSIDTIQSNQDSVVLFSYNISYISNGQTSGESGEFAVNNDKLSLCQENEDEASTCRFIDLSIKENGMSLISNNEITGCKETLVFLKEE
ncbi:MAG: hypothetical protein RIC53_08160 [Cyclobacteriaceae bacterium]